MSDITLLWKKRELEEHNYFPKSWILLKLVLRRKKVVPTSPLPPLPPYSRDSVPPFAPPTTVTCRFERRPVRSSFGGGPSETGLGILSAGQSSFRNPFLPLLASLRYLLISAPRYGRRLRKAGGIRPGKGRGETVYILTPFLDPNLDLPIRFLFCRYLPPSIMAQKNRAFLLSPPLPWQARAGRPASPNPPQNPLKRRTCLPPLPNWVTRMSTTALSIPRPALPSPAAAAPRQR